MARTYAEIQALKPTTPEQTLIAACKEGQFCTLGDGTRPDGPDPARVIRAEVLRYLILGGCDDCRVQEWGVQLVGAYVEGALDLSFATAKGATTMARCRFAQPIVAMQTRVEMLALNDSLFPGLNAQGMNSAGPIVLRGVAVYGEVSLSGARIGGQLSCTGARFSNAKGKALNAQGVDVTADAFLTNVKADGEVRLAGARIGGQLACTGARFSNAKGDALNAQRLGVTEGLIWREVKVTEGSVDLASAQIGDLVDDLSSWPEAGRLILDGFTYDRISAAFTDTRQRLDWLSRGTVSADKFFPQPYTHLAKVYREMGHDKAARAVLVERNRLLAVHERETIRKAAGDASWKDLRLAWSWAVDWLLHHVVGYGYRPLYSLWWLIGLWALTVWLAVSSWHEGSMVPASAVVLTSPDWRAIEADRQAAAFWSATRGPGQDYETFSAAGWAADLVVPILDLGQTAAWAPSTARGPVGAVLWWARWLLQAAGWLVMGLFAAAVTGIIRREED